MLGALTLVVLSSVPLPYAAHAQTSVSVAIDLSPSASVEEGTAIAVTMSFGNLTFDDDRATTDYAFRADVVGADACEGSRLGVDRYMYQVDENPETRDATIAASCPAGDYTIQASVSSPGNEELASASTAFSVAAPPPPTAAIALAPSDTVIEGDEIVVTMSFGNLEGDSDRSDVDYIFRADVKDSEDGNADQCEDRAGGFGLGVDRYMWRVDEDPEVRTGTISASCASGDHTVEVSISSPDNVELASATAHFTVAAPEVSIVADTTPVTEGADATFALSRTGPTKAALTVDVSVTESRGMLSGTPPATAKFAVGDSSATLTVATANDNVVEAASDVTATITATNDDRYQIAANEATVTVEDNDTAEFALAVSPATITEAGTGAATVTAIITNSVTFARDQDIAISLGGSAAPGSDFTFTDAEGRTLSRPYALRLREGMSSVTGTVTAVNDARDDDAETIVIVASYGGIAIDTAHTLTITDDDDASGLELKSLAVTGDGRDMYPQFDPGTLHYGVRCSDQDTLTLILSTKDEDTRLVVNGIQQISNQNAEVELSGVNSDSDIVVLLSNVDGAATTYVVHCLAADFPVITAKKTSGASDGLITFSVRSDNQETHKWFYVAVIDNNGVPRFRHRIDSDRPGTHFKYHKDGKYPFSYAQPAGDIPNYIGSTQRNWMIVVLNEELEQVQTVQAAAPLAHTNAHDFVIKGNGNYVLMAYEPTERDLSDFLDEHGKPYSATEGTSDSVIQEVTPEGVEVNRWNSWDHMAVEDCTQHRFPNDYAHINSLQEVDEGDIIASFRGCSKVLRIDGATGDVEWRLGRSNRSDEDWEALGVPPPLAILNDPYGEFCGQHSARIIGNGNLVLFDNGGHCVFDPKELISQRQGGNFSRVVEYSLDLDEGEATFMRHHSLHGTDNMYARSQGHIELMESGNWLVSWGRGHLDDDPHTPLPPDTSISEVDPSTGEEVLSIKLTYAGNDVVLPTRAYFLRHDQLALARAIFAPIVTWVSFGGLAHNVAGATVTVGNPDGSSQTVHLRYRTGGCGEHGCGGLECGANGNHDDCQLEHHAERADAGDRI